MSRPLIPNPKRAAEAAKFHAAVFFMFGGEKKICSLCGVPNATDAAHVIGRAHLGPLRYADPRLARPAHRSCHVAVDAHRISWPLAIRQDAAIAHNLLAKVKLMVPTE